MAAQAGANRETRQAIANELPLIQAKNLSTVADQHQAAAELSKLLRQRGINRETRLQIMQLVGLDNATVGATGATVGHTAALQGYAGAVRGATGANAGFAASLKTMLQTPSGVLAVISMLASVIATVLIPVIKNAIHTASELREEYEQDRQKLSELHDQYKENAERIGELIEAKKGTDFSDKNAQELEDLRDQNIEIESQITLYERLAEAKRQAATKATDQEWMGGSWDSWKYQFKTGKTRTEKLQGAIRSLEILNGQRQGAYDEYLSTGDRSHLDRIDQSIAEIIDANSELIYEFDEFKDNMSPAVREEIQLLVDRFGELATVTDDADRIVASLDKVVSSAYRDGTSHGDALAGVNKNVVLEMLEVKQAAEEGSGSVKDYNDQLAKLLATLRRLVTAGRLPQETFDIINELLGLDVDPNQIASRAVSQTSIAQNSLRGEDVLANWLNTQSVQTLQQFEKYLDQVDTTGIKTTNDLIAGFKEWQAVVDQSSGPQSGFNFDALDGLKDRLSTLSAALKEINDDDSLGVTYSTLSKIAEQFADVDGIDTYIARLAQAGNQSDIVKGILDELANELLKNEAYSEAFANADEGVIDALLREAGASRSTKAAMYELRVAMINANNTGLNFSGQIQALRALAQEAGLTAASINSIFAGQDLTAAGTGDWDEIANMTPAQLEQYRLTTSSQNLMAQLRRQLSIEISDVVTPPGGGGGGGSVEDYIVDIDKYRDAIRRLEAAQKEREDLEHEISRTESPQRQVLQNRQVIDTYEREQAALHDLNEARRETIFENIKRLEELGFVVEYNAELNDFWIVNLEHVNELQQDIRKSTEELIEATDDLNESNKDGSKNWWDLNDSIADARKQINSLLKDIVDNASKAVDQMQSVYDTLHKAADEYASSGYVTIDTVQSLISLGTEYMQYLVDENGQLVINEERVKAAVKAKMEQLAVENALVYVEALSIAQAEGNTAELNRLLFATQETTKGTWGLVYATIAYLNLTEEERQAAYHNVDTMRALAEMASDTIGSELERMKDGVDSILKYVQEMLKAQSQAIIDSLNEQKQAYSEIIDRQKESLQLRKKEADYSKSVEKRLKDIAKLQARIDALSLDNSRSAQAERAKLLEQLAEQQEELADAQNDHAVEAQEKALDEMNDAYAKQKDKEIKAEEDKYSSAQKLYDASIKYIEQHWNTLYDELIDWNTQYGSVLNSEITSAWDNCLAAAERYGSYVAALNTIGSDLAAERSTSGIVGTTPKYDHSITNADKKNSPIIASYVNQMKANSRAWRNTNNPDQQRDLADDNQRIADILNGSPYYLGITRDSSGYWIMEDGSILYDLDNPSRGVFHQGGIVGDSTLRQDELFATLQKGELVLTKQQQSVVAGMVDFMSAVKSRLSGELSRVRVPSLGVSNYLDILSAAGEVGGETTVNFGDVYITGTDKDNIAKYREVNREFVNEVVKVLNIRK